jgi:hypothetical protein
MGRMVASQRGFEAELPSISRLIRSRTFDGRGCAAACLDFHHH